MSGAGEKRSQRFRELHGPGQLLLLPNAWDAASARLIEECGAAAIATTSAGLAWSRGYADGNNLPPRLLAAAVGEIARVLRVPLSVDSEGGYSSDPREVGETVAALVDGGAVGINIEDGTAPADLLCAKIAACKSAAARAGFDLFVNARTDVLLRRLVPPERAVAETIDRARRYREAGADGLFVPDALDARVIRDIASAIDLPLNVLARPTLPPVAELKELGVRRVSAGAALARAAYGAAQRAARRFLEERRCESLFDTAGFSGDLNTLLSLTK